MCFLSVASSFLLAGHAEKTLIIIMARPGAARRGLAGQGMARLGGARHGEARRGVARQGFYSISRFWLVKSARAVGGLTPYLR